VKRPGLFWWLRPGARRRRRVDQVRGRLATVRDREAATNQVLDRLREGDQR
jgi:hypothetical protein